MYTHVRVHAHTHTHTHTHTQEMKFCIIVFNVNYKHTLDCKLSFETLQRTHELQINVLIYLVQSMFTCNAHFFCRAL